MKLWKEPEMLPISHAILYLCRSYKNREIDDFIEYLKIKIKNGYKLEVPDWAIDGHTEAGRKIIKQKNITRKEKFYKEGALLDKEKELKMVMFIRRNYMRNWKFKPYKKWALVNKYIIYDFKGLIFKKKLNNTYFIHNTHYKRKYDKLSIILELEEAQNLLRQPNKRYPTGLRNKAIMFLMLHCGLRISEVVKLKPSNINLTKDKLRIESGKGNKNRDLPIPEYLTDLLYSWRKKRPESTYFF